MAVIFLCLSLVFFTAFLCDFNAFPGTSPHAKGIPTVSDAALVAAHFLAKDFAGSSACERLSVDRASVLLRHVHVTYQARRNAVTPPPARAPPDAPLVSRPMHSDEISLEICDGLPTNQALQP